MVEAPDMTNLLQALVPPLRVRRYLDPYFYVCSDRRPSGFQYQLGAVTVAVVGFAGIIVTQILTSRRDKAQLQHLVSAALRQRRLEAYAELIGATNDLMLLIPEVLTDESGAGALKGSERGPMNAASSKAHLLASPSVQTEISELVNVVYAYADGRSQESWEAFDHAMDAFVDAAQAEADHGNTLGRPVARRQEGRKQSGG